MDWEQGRLSALSKREQAAIEAVAGRLAARYEETEATSGVTFLIGGQKIAVEVSTVRLPVVDGAVLARPRLRFDKVAIRLVKHVQTALRGSVPDGTTVIFTITAPIRLAAKTAEALEGAIRACLLDRPAKFERKDAVHGNKIRIRVLKCSPRQVSRVIGLVHNPDTDSDLLLNTTQELLQHVGAAAYRRAFLQSANARWLIVIIEGGYSHIETYRQLFAQLSMPTDFAKILMVLDGSRVETLMG
jgi:hypothetical protein